MADAILATTLAYILRKATVWRSRIPATHEITAPLFLQDNFKTVFTENELSHYTMHFIADIVQTQGILIKRSYHSDQIAIKQNKALNISDNSTGTLKWVRSISRFNTPL